MRRPGEGTRLLMQRPKRCLSEVSMQASLVNNIRRERDTD
jgi:hypothetical protein